MEKDTHIIEIKEYNNYLIVTLIDKKTPKMKFVGAGVMLTNFNGNDIKISPQALNILIKNIGNTYADPAFEIISKDKLWWAGKNGIIIPPDELINVFILPHHTVCDNEIDEKLKKVLI